MSKKNKPHTSRAISSFFNPLIQPTFTRDVANENPQNQSIVQPNIANENHPPQTYVEQILPGNVCSEIIESYSLLQPSISANVSSDKPQARSDHPVQEVLPETFSNYSDHPKPKNSKTEIAFEKKQKRELAFVTGVNPHFVNGKPPSAGFREFQTVFKNHGKNLKPWIFSHSSFLRTTPLKCTAKC